jgi:hypothetical protein
MVAHSSTIFSFISLQCSIIIWTMLTNSIYPFLHGSPLDLQALSNPPSPLATPPWPWSTSSWWLRGLRFLCSWIETFITGFEGHPKHLVWPARGSQNDISLH